MFEFFFSSRRRHTRSLRDWSSDVCSSDLDSGLNFARLAQAHHGHANGREIAKFADGMDAGFEVLDFRDGPVLFIHPDTFGGLLNIDEALLVIVDKRTKENAAHKAEDRRICADTEG